MSDGRQPRPFATTIRQVNAAHFLLRAWDDATSPVATTDPDLSLALPMPDDVELPQFLANGGAHAGRWRVELHPLAANKQAARMRLDRLAALGPVVEVVAVTDDHVAAARDRLAELEQQVRNGPRVGRPAAAPRVDESPSVRQARERVQERKHANELLEQELRAKQLQKAMAEVERAATAGGAGLGLAGIVAPFAPLLVELVRSFLDNQRRQAETLAELAARAAAPAPPAAGELGAGGLTLDAVVTLLPQLKTLGKLLGMGGRSDDDDDREPRSELGELVTMARELLGAARGETPAAAPAVPVPVAPVNRLAPVANGHAPAPPRTPEELMQARVQSFLLAVMQEQAATADPADAADRLFGSIGQLPEGFRALLVSSTTVETLLQGLPPWLPLLMRQKVPELIRRDERKRQWLAAFLDAIRENAAAAG